MNPERDAAIEKIKKLLRMKRGGTQAEVETALALAQEIARKHGIDMSSVNPEEEEQARPIGYTETIRTARIQYECSLCGLVCENFFNVTVFAYHVAYRKHCLVFVGTEWDRQIAVYIYTFLVRHFRREWKTKSGRCRNRKAFMWGIYNGLCSKLTVAQPPVDTNALVLIGQSVQRRANYISKHFGETKSSSAKPDRDSDQAYYRGWLAGRDTNIRPAVETAQPKHLQIGL